MKQERPSTDKLRSIWLTKFGWKSDEAAANWTAAGGDKSKTFEPKVGGAVCEMDHVVELQIGGNNTADNIQALDREENGKSGREIFQSLKDLAARIRQIYNAAPGAAKLDTVILHFDSVQQPAAACKPKSCCAVEQKAATVSGAASDTAVKETTEPYEIVAGSSTTLQLPQGTLKKPKKNKAEPIADSTNAQTKAASTLIPGMILKTLHLNPNGDTIDGVIDTENEKTRSSDHTQGCQGCHSTDRKREDP